MSIGPLHFFFKEILKVDVSRGWLYESGTQVSEALPPVWEILGEEIRRASVVNMDETGFDHKHRDWIWVAHTTRTVFFHFSTTRGFDALKAMLPEDFSFNTPTPYANWGVCRSGAPPMDVAAFLAMIYPALPIEDERGKVWVEFRRRKHHPFRYIKLERAVRIWSKCPKCIRIFHLDPTVGTESPAPVPEPEQP